MNNEPFKPSLVAQLIALRSMEPTRDPGRPEWRYELMDGRPWYIQPRQVGRVRNLGVKAGTPFRVCLRQYSKDGACVLDVKLATPEASEPPAQGFPESPSPAPAPAALSTQPDSTTVQPEPIIPARPKVRPLPDRLYGGFPKEVAPQTNVRLISPLPQKTADAMTKLGEVLLHGIPPEPPDLPLTDADIPAPKKATARVNGVNGVNAVNGHNGNGNGHVNGRNITPEVIAEHEQRLLRFYEKAIDLAIQVRELAKAKGIDLGPPSFNDIRCLAAVDRIGVQRGGQF